MGLSSRQSPDFIKDDMQGGYDVTNLFAILAAKDLQKYPTVSGKAPRVIVYKGNNKLEGKSDVTGQTGYALAFPKMLAYIRERTPHREEMRTGLRVTIYEYPEISVRELVANALIHQNFMSVGGPRIEIFRDRITITNPGSPLIELQRLIEAPAKSRNERLAGVMRQLGFCEERGSGIKRAITAIESEALPPPTFETTEDFTVVTMFRNKDFGQLSRDQRMYACYLHSCLKQVSGDQMSNGSLRIRFGLSSRRYPQVSVVIADALSAGLIKPLDPDQGNRNARYIPFWAA